MNDAALHRFTMEAKLRGAIERNEFSLHYQPQFDVGTGGGVGDGSAAALDEMMNSGSSGRPN